MDKINKLAEIFENKANSEIFGKVDEVSLSMDSKKLSQIAGKMIYQSKRVSDPSISKRLHHASKAILEAVDALKGKI